MQTQQSLSEELAWRGFVNQTTLKDPSVLDDKSITFYFGVDPSADSMTIGNLASAMMVRHFMEHGHKAILLVGGATGLIGDPDGKSKQRDLKSVEQINRNKKAIAEQYERVFEGLPFTVVDNYDWFKNFNYIDFLRDVGMHVPMRQMLGREFVQKRLGEDGNGISYGEFSYSLIQGYDYVHLNKEFDVTLQLCGADQWGNSIAGVDLVRRINGKEVHIWSSPLVVNKSTGIKFGKSEDGAVWLDSVKTTPTSFYQFWINLEDDGIEGYLKIYTLLDKDEIDTIMADHNNQPHLRHAQKRLASEVTKLVHGEKIAIACESVTQFLTNPHKLEDLTDPYVIELLRGEVKVAASNDNGSIIDALDVSGLVASKSEARRLLAANAISINGEKISRENFESTDFKNGRLLLRKGKKYKDSALIELS